MSQLIIRDQAVYMDGYDLQNRSKSIALEYSAALLDNTALGSSTITRLAGLKNVVASIEGFMDVDAADAAMFNNISLIDKPITISALDDTIGTPAYFFNAGFADLTLGASVGEIAPFKLGADSSSGQLVRGTIMVNSRAAALTTTGSTAARQLGAIAAGKRLYACCHFWNVGTGSITVAIKSDSTNAFSGAETTRITHTAATAIGSEIKSVAGSITDTWWKVYYTISGGAPSFKMICTLGIL